MSPAILSQVMQGAKAQGAKSTAMQPLIWLNAALIAGVATGAAAKAPAWVTAVELVFLGIGVIAFVGVYVFFASTDPDNLRSEQFTLSKIALENKLGDDQHGFNETEPIEFDVTLSEPEQTQLEKPAKSPRSKAKKTEEPGA